MKQDLLCHLQTPSLAWLAVCDSGALRSETRTPRQGLDFNETLLALTSTPVWTTAVSASSGFPSAGNRLLGEPQQPRVPVPCSLQGGQLAGYAGRGSGSAQQGRAARGPNGEPRAGRLGTAGPTPGPGMRPLTPDSRTATRWLSAGQVQMALHRFRAPHGPGSQGLWEPACGLNTAGQSAAPPRDSSKTPSPGSSYATCLGHAPQSGRM